MVNIPEGYNLKEVLELIVKDPKLAADRLDQMAIKLKDIAQKLREEKLVNPTKHIGGMSEKICVNVVGPDGNIKQKTDFGG